MHLIITHGSFHGIKVDARVWDLDGETKDYRIGEYLEIKGKRDHEIEEYIRLGTDIVKWFKESEK